MKYNAGDVVEYIETNSIYKILGYYVDNSFVKLLNLQKGNVITNYQTMYLDNPKLFRIYKKKHVTKLMKFILS